MPNPTIRNRITGSAEVDPSDLLANPRNFRVHPDRQRTALTGVLEKIGWVQYVIVNERSGTVIDGHLRVAVALSRGEPVLPVSYVDLTEEEERAILATFDQITGMAGTDADLYEQLMQDIATGDRAYVELVEGVAEAAATGMSVQDAGLAKLHSVQKLPGRVWVLAAIPVAQLAHATMAVESLRRIPNAAVYTTLSDAGE